MILLDTVFMVANVNNTKPELIYGRPGTHAKEAWDNVIEDEVMGTGVTKEWLHNKGFRAVRVMVVSVP